MEKLNFCDTLFLAVPAIFVSPVCLPRVPRRVLRWIWWQKYEHLFRISNIVRII